MSGHARGERWLPTPLGETVTRELARLGQAPVQGGDMAALVAAWPAAVGDVIARNAWPARFTRDGTLLVHTSSSTWAFELSQLEVTVRSSLGKLSPLHLRFVVGPVPEPATPVNRASGAQRSIHTLPAETVARGAEMARGIEAESLREAVARAAAASLAASQGNAEPTGASDTIHKA